jgi:hypothetical protein
MLKILSICGALSLLLGSSAMAQSRVCASDIKKACADIEPGNGRVAACLKEHLKDLSDECKTRLAGAAAAAKTCRADVNKECGSVRPIQKLACIRDAITNLSDACKTTIAAVASGKK